NFAELRRSVDAEACAVAAAAKGNAGRQGSHLPPVETVAPVLSSESFDRIYEDASRNSEIAAESRVLQRSRSASIGMGASLEQTLALPAPPVQMANQIPTSVPTSVPTPAPVQLNNQGHDGSISALVQAKLASEFSKHVRVSTRLISDASTESSYGTFIRFHPSGELNGIFASEAKRRSSLCRVQAIAELPSDQEDNGENNVPADSNPGDGSSGYARNQESIRLFVEKVRAQRQESTRRRREAEAQQHVLGNSQAVLDASLYVHERQKRAEAAAAVEKQQQMQKQQQQQQMQTGPDVPTLGTAAAAPARDGASATDTVMPPRNRRRKSDGPGKIPARNSEARRRETVFGMFCGPGRSLSPEPSLLEHRDAVLKRAAVTGPPRRRSKHRPISYINKDLPPLPAQSRPLTATPNGPLHGSIRSTMKRSQSFSHFGAADSERVRWNTRPDTDVEDAEDGRPQRRHHGFLSGILNRLTSGHSRRKSSGIADAPGPRKLTRRPRHQRAIDDSTEESEEVLTVAVVDEPETPPNVSISVPRKTLSAEICAGIVQNTAGTAMSSTHRRMYTNVLSSLSSPEDESFDTSGSPQAPPSAELVRSGSRGLYPHLSLAASNVESSRSIGPIAAGNEPPSARRADGDAWRDSAVTGLLTQASAGTSKGHAGVAAMPEETPALGGHTASLDADAEDEENTERYTHAVRFRERRSIVERTSDVAMNTITARDRSEWLQELDEHKGKSLPHSHATSRVDSSNGSFAEMIASAGSEYMRQHRMPELPGIEGFSRPASSRGLNSPSHGRHGSSSSRPASTPELPESSPELAAIPGLMRLLHSSEMGLPQRDNDDDEMDLPLAADEMEIPSLADDMDLNDMDLNDVDLPLPANEKLRQLESEVLFGGQRPRPFTADAVSDSKTHMAMQTACDSPISDAGTGRTRILDFAETSVKPDSTHDSKCRRPSARPEIKDVRSILWSDTNSEAGCRPGGLGLVDTDAVDTPTVLNSVERTAQSGSETPGFQAMGTPESFPKQAAEGSEAHDRQHLARLVQNSPDPRNLIYDAGSQFGSMRSHESRGTDVAEAKAMPRLPLPQDLVARHN
ncbi:hypothetical protein GGF43_004195, partial [Coemansia sp. RSA 2618]